MARTDYYGIQTPVLQATSQAIRTVNGTVGTIAPEDYPDLIAAMKSGTDYDNVMAQLVEETTTPAAIASFTDGANNLPVKELVCTINPTETGTGAKSPSNPYVIGGHTGINLYQRGTNLWDEEWEVGSIDPANGAPSVANNVIRSKNFIPVKGSVTYYLTSLNVYAIFQYDKDYNFLQYNQVTTNTFSLRSEAKYIKFRTKAAYGTTYNNDISINYPSTDTAYHAYNGRTHHADFGQTVYGGSLNVTTGVLTVTHAYYKTTGNEDFKSYTYSSKNGVWAENVLPYMGNRPPYVSNMSTYSRPTLYQSGSLWCGANSKNLYWIGILDILEMTLEQFKVWIVNNPLEVAYELRAEDQFEIQLDPIEVRTMLGANNIYHDCNGNIEVEYRANGALYVAQH